MKRWLILFLICLNSLASTTLSGQKHRFNFAQSYLGLQSDVLPAFTANQPAYFAQRLILGGTHFWYRADFYISFPLFVASATPDNQHFSEGVITGARYLPFGPGKKWPLPFAGVQWMTPSVQLTDGPEMQRNRLGLEFGLSSVVMKKQTLELRVQHMVGSSWDYPVSRTEILPVEVPAWNFSVAFKRYIDVTAGNATPNGQQFLNRARKVFENERVMSAWSLAIGLSSNIPLSNYDFALEAEYFPPVPRAALLPDIALSYYWQKPDFGISFSWRPVSFNQAAYGHEWKMTEHRIAAECQKFLFDYHGFVPFVGLSLGAVHQNFSERDHEYLIHRQIGWRPAAALVLGWDIRPTDVEWFILRTNLRYLPPIGRIRGDRLLNAHHLEVNFIQFVLYPQRLLKLKNAKS